MTYATRGHLTGRPTYTDSTGTGSMARRWSQAATGSGTDAPPEAQAWPCALLRPAMTARRAGVMPATPHRRRKSAGSTAVILVDFLAERDKRMVWQDLLQEHKPFVENHVAFIVTKRSRNEYDINKLVCRQAPHLRVHLNFRWVHGRASSVIGAARLTAPGVGLALPVAAAGNVRAVLLGKHSQSAECSPLLGAALVCISGKAHLSEYARRANLEVKHVNGGGAFGLDRHLLGSLSRPADPVRCVLYDSIGWPTQAGNERRAKIVWRVGERPTPATEHHHA